MRILFKTGLLCALVLLAASAASAQGGLVCGNPQESGCQPQYDDFKSHDLTFLTGRAQLGTGTRHESDEFYAVVLESVRAARKGSGCNYINEKKRLAIQRMFPSNKVFASRNGCSGTIVVYDSVDNNFNFVAVYGGGTEEDARAILNRARKRYPQANIRKMRVVLDFADQ
ncbi:MAG: hypothetical protein ICV68_01890 [Pyrinomonadaceae bacterium]|nr:hypothetical protein [Pyrinomonadaceae bacterium]